VSRWEVANHIAADEEVSFQELAKRCGIPEQDFTRILRQAMSKHIFKEPRKGYVAHTAASKLFIPPTQLNDYVHIALDNIWQSAAHMLDAMEKWNFSQEPNTTGFNLAKGTDEPFFGSMKSNEKRKKAFANNMSYMQARHGFGSALGHLVSAFDWNSIKKVVDIGGGLGDTALEIARNTAETICVVQDLPDVISQARERDTGTFGDRVIFMEHDFFEEQPIRDADVFFLRWILHDWSDEVAKKILRALVPALRPGSHVILQEFVVPESGQVPFYFEKTIRYSHTHVIANIQR
jgi:SAM-dependent methyltransferase